MGNRIELHSELIQFSSNVYFQPPSDIRMVYPCIVYNLKSMDINHANDKIYKYKKEYTVTIMSKDPEDLTAENVILHFPYARPGDKFMVEGIYQTPVTLYY